MNSAFVDIVKQSLMPGFSSLPYSEIDRLATRLRRSMKAFTGPTIRVAVLSSFLTDYLVDVLRLMLARRGIAATITSAGYGQLINEILTQGPVLTDTPDVVLVLPTYRDLRCTPQFDQTREQAQKAVAEEVRFWSDLVSRISTPIVMLSFNPPPHRILADGDGFLAGGLTHHARRVNLALADALPSRVALVDSEALFAQLGAAANDARLYSICKQPFAMEALPRFADALAACVAAQMGRAKKVLVLDLDNTLWGGVVGDVGIEGLALGPETPEGEAFVAFQRYVQALGRRGVILAVCSKNHDHIARAAFRDHPAMVLKESDIACFVASFDDKASNIRRIRESLNVGLDSMVFVDDNPVERAWITNELPEVFVVDLPDDPAYYADAIDSANLFPLYRLTQEDLTRTRSYQAIATLKDGHQGATNLEAFLQDLAPQACVERVDGGSFDRIVQLIGKTNQFKLNPTIFTHEDIREGAAGVIALRLVDRLQDYGIVAVAVTKSTADVLAVHNWVMSCRVFGRRLEHVMRELLLQEAQRAGADRIVLPFVPSAKNGLVPSVLSGLGFVDDSDHGHYVALTATAVELPPHHMVITDKRITDSEYRSAVPEQELI